MGAPAMAVRNATDETLTVLDGEGRPFLRIGRSGVFTNVESPMSYRSVDPARDRVPGGLHGRARWARLSREAAWSWFDPRLTYEKGTGSWSVPMRLEKTDVRAVGGFEPLAAHGHFKTQVSVPEVEGVQVRTAEGPVPGFFARNDTDETLHIAGPSGEPFLRIGPNGVFANVRSPSYFTSALQTIGRVPAGVDLSAPPRWKRVSDVPAWAWLERRAAVPSSLQERDRLGSTRHVVLEWTTQMRLGHRSLPLVGRVSWVPPHHSVTSGSSGGERTYWAPVVVVLAGSVWLGLRGRRVRIA
jgi:hypothetical protein